MSSANEFKDEIADVQIAISYEKDKIIFMEILRQLLKDIEQDVMHYIIHEDKEWILKLLQTKNSLAK